MAAQAVLCERIMQGLMARGVEVEPLRWWDSRSRAAIFSRHSVFADNVTLCGRQRALKVFSLCLPGRELLPHLRGGVMVRPGPQSDRTNGIPGGRRSARISHGRICVGIRGAPLPLKFHIFMLYMTSTVRGARAILHGVDPSTSRQGGLGAATTSSVSARYVAERTRWPWPNWRTICTIPIKFVGKLAGSWIRE